MNHSQLTTKHERRDTSDMRRNRPLHLSRTLYKSATFYAKQTQFPKSQMNVNLYNTTDYENKSNWTIGENKPNSNPIKPNCRKGKN